MLDHALGALDAEGSRALGLWVDPGIGKSRLLGINHPPVTAQMRAGSSVRGD